MAFVGNLKSALVRKAYNPVTPSLNALVDKDMLVAITDTLDMYLEQDYSNSTIYKRILCQARKTNGILKLE